MFLDIKNDIIKTYVVEGDQSELYYFSAKNAIKNVFPHVLIP